MIPADGQTMTTRWVEELHALGYHDPEPDLLAGVFAKTGEVDRDAAVEVILTRLGAKRSAWNAADVRGEAERLITRENVVAEAAVRLELAEDLTARTLAASVPLLGGRVAAGVPEHIRALTSAEVLAVEADLVARLAARATGDVQHAQPVAVPGIAEARLDAAQIQVVTELAGDARLLDGMT
ncbi:MAG: hypothetical protein QM655_04000 [Nocardioidaceae bacterium]